MNTHNCTSCHADFPNTATFCPFCGVSAPEATPFNRTLVNELVREPSPNDTHMMEPVEDFRPGRKHGLKLLAGVAVTSAVIAGVFVGTWLADLVHQPMQAPAAITELEVAPSAPEVVPEVVVSANADGGFDIMRGAEVVHTVNTSDGSRYASLDERMRSVAVRFKHISSKGEGRFAARLVGEHHELVWSDSNGDFRLLDITKLDAADAKSNTDFAANYLADRLNADLPQLNNS